MLTVLFLCTQNAGRSQMAEAFFNRLAAGKAVAISAGSRPAEKVHPAVVQVMQDLGIDLSSKIPQELTPYLLSLADKAVTMGCGESCPVTGLSTIEWHIEDPSGKSINEARTIRDEIKHKVEKLLEELKI
jgi:protein-tyrosine-phosphatase